MKIEAIHAKTLVNAINKAMDDGELQTWKA